MNKKLIIFFKTFIRELSEFLSIIYFYGILLNLLNVPDEINFWTVTISIIYVVVAINLVEWSWKDK